MLSPADLTTLIIYFLLIIGVGVVLSKKASGSISDYYLGGRTIPWYILGISGMATFLSLSGSMHVASLYLILGVKGFLTTFRGHLALVLAFLMIFVAKWLNRSGVMTNAEWIEFRFGRDRQGRLARFLAALSNTIVSVSIMAFFFVAAEKFFALYLPFNPKIGAIIFFAAVMVYTVSSGFYGVVYTDLIQSVLMFGVIVFFAVKAIAVGTPDYYARFTTADWHSLTPSWRMEMPEGYESMEMFGLLVIFWILSSVLQGFAIPTDGFISQRYYAAKNERESALVAWQWIALLSLRFLMMTAVAVLALGITDTFNDPEKAFPAVIDYYIPGGFKGLVLAGLIAAEMSSLDSIANSSAAYIVKDIYQEFIRPGAERRELMKLSYISTAALFVLSVVMGLTIPNLNSLWAWIIMGLVTGMLPPNALKWFWWRFNGLGYAFGMVTGIIAAVLHSLVFDGAPEYITFMFVLAISTVGSIAGTFIGDAPDREVLNRFFRKTKPFGFWESVRRELPDDFVTEVRRENRRDILLIAPACLWQIVLFWSMSALVVKKWWSFSISMCLVGILSYILYKWWYRNLKCDDDNGSDT